MPGPRVNTAPRLTWNTRKCHRNIHIGEDELDVECTEYGWGGVLGSWVMGEGEHFWEVRIDRSKMGMGIYLGVTDANFDPQQRGQGMSSFMPAAKSAYQYKRGWSYYCYTGDLFNEGRVIGATDVFARTGDTVTCKYDGTAGELSFYKNGELLCESIAGITGEVSPVVDLNLNSKVIIMEHGCYSNGTVRNSDYNGSAHLVPQGVGPSAGEFVIRSEMENSFALSAGLMVNKERHTETNELSAARDHPEQKDGNENCEDKPDMTQPLDHEMTKNRMKRRSSLTYM
jgi:hypothetical protein